MLSVRQYPYSRLVQLANTTGSDIHDVRIRYSTEGSGDGTQAVADRLAPGESATWSLASRRQRIRALSVVYRVGDTGTQVHSDLLRAPQRAYFRWLRCELRADGQIVGFGRAQGLRGSAYYPGQVSAEAFDPAEVDEPQGATESGTGDAPRRTNFIELVSFASNPVRIRAVSVLDTDGGAHEIPVDLVLRPGAHFDVEIEGAGLAVHQCKVSYEKDGATRGAIADFTIWGHTSLQYGSVLWEGDPDVLAWWGWAEWDSALATPLPERPQVVVEVNPAPEFPDAFCSSPMRLRNLESYPVHVRYVQTFWNEGDLSLCNSTPTDSDGECTLPPKGVLPLGCSSYKTPNMYCAWNRRWRVVSTVRVS